MITINNLDIEKLKEILLGTNGKVFRVSFVKKNGELRNMTCRLGVKSRAKGSGKPSYALQKDNPYQLVFDFQKDGYRVVNLDTIQEIKFQDTLYKKGNQ